MMLLNKKILIHSKRCESRTGSYWCHNKTLINFYTCGTG